MYFLVVTVSNKGDFYLKKNGLLCCMAQPWTIKIKLIASLIPSLRHENWGSIGPTQLIVYLIPSVNTIDLMVTSDD